MIDVASKLESLKNTIETISSLDASFVDDIEHRLESFGYMLEEADSWMIGFAIQKVENNIKNECNTSGVPDGLKQVAVDMVCGEFLFSKKGSGQLQGFNIDLEVAVKQIQEGDTNVTFAFGDGNMTPEQRLNALIALLLGSGKAQFVSYRCLKW